MPRIADLDPADLAVLVREAPALLDHLAALADEDLDAVLHVAWGLFGQYEIAITGLRGDLIVCEFVASVLPGDDRTRLVLLRLIARQAVEKQERWWRSTNRWLRARGLPEVR